MKDCGCKECKCTSASLEHIVQMIEDQTLPFVEEVLDETSSIRIFSHTHPDHLFKWHFDEEDRRVEPLHYTDWEFQFDDDLPFRIEGEIFIPAGIYHRLIKGTSPLELKITRC